MLKIKLGTVKLFWVSCTSSGASEKRAAKPKWNWRGKWAGEPVMITQPFSSGSPVEGGGRGTQQSFIREGSAPRSKPLPFYIPFLTEKVPLSYTFHRKWYPFDIPTEQLLLNFSRYFECPF